MDAELLALCKQTVTKYAFVGYDDHNDFTWQTNVTSQHVTLTGTTASLVLSPTGGQTIMTGMVVKDTTDTTTYGLNTDYTIDYTAGTIVRTAASTIPSGATVHVSYSWQTIVAFAARVEFTNTLIRNNEGQEVVSTCQIYCDGTVVIDERDKITISGTLVVYPEILKIAHNPDENGAIDHHVIYTK